MKIAVQDYQYAKYIFYSWARPHLHSGQLCKAEWILERRGRGVSFSLCLHTKYISITKSYFSYTSNWYSSLEKGQPNSVQVVHIKETIKETRMFMLNNFLPLRSYVKFKFYCSVSGHCHFPEQFGISLVLLYFPKINLQNKTSPFWIWLS